MARGFVGGGLFRRVSWEEALIGGRISSRGGLVGRWEEWGIWEEGLVQGWAQGKKKKPEVKILGEYCKGSS